LKSTNIFCDAVEKPRIKSLVRRWSNHKKFQINSNWTVRLVTDRHY